MFVACRGGGPWWTDRLLNPWLPYLSSCRRQQCLDWAGPPKTTGPHEGGTAVQEMEEQNILKNFVGAVCTIEEERFEHVFRNGKGKDN